jgi:hypothetical protein
MKVESNKTYVGVVQQNDDPKKLGRVKVRVLGIFDKMELKDIPWATPWKDLNGNGFNVPEVGKLVTVVFDSANEYKPEYIYADYYNINLEKKLQSLEGDNYLSMKALIFDHKTQIYVNDEEGLKIDHKYNQVNITNSEINLCLKDNRGKLHIGDSHGDQQSILGTNFLNWFDKFIDALMCLQGPPYLVPVPISPSPSFLSICQQYKALKFPKFLSDNIYMNDNGAVNTIKTDTSTDPNLRIDDPQIGDNLKTNIQEIKTENKIDNSNNKPTEGSGTESPIGVDGNGQQVPLSGESGDSNGNQQVGESKEVIIPTTNPNVDRVISAMRKKKSTKGEFYKLEEKPYYLNLIGIRTQYEGQLYSNKFVDIMWGVWKNEKDQWEGVSWPISTIPGLYFSGFKTQKKWCLESNGKGGQNRPGGLGIMAEGQYLNVYTLHEAESNPDRHFKKSPYFVNAPIQLSYRDKNWDSNLITFSNKSKPQAGGHGMFIHRGFPNGGKVNTWSQGCQVFEKEGDYNQLISLARRHIKHHNNKFHYTLLLSSDFIDQLISR